MLVNQERLAQITAPHHGDLEPPDGDDMECICPAIAAFVLFWKYAPSGDDHSRNSLLLPLVPRFAGTRGSEALKERRAMMAADWLVRIHTPAWLRLAGLSTGADLLAGLPEIVALSQIHSIRSPLEVARPCAVATGATTLDADLISTLAAGTAALAAWDSARNSNWDIGMSSAWNTAGHLSWAIAVASIRNADRAELASTVAELQASAVVLLERMIDAKEAA